jgi:ADP-heptose:LPS heptosyltransferase
MPGDRILFVTLSNIGDAILTTPVLLALNERYPECRVDIVAGPRSAAVFECCPFRERTLLKEKDRFLRGLPALAGTLRKVRYRLAVDLRTDLLGYLVRSERRFLRWRARPYGRHALERHMGTIAALHGDRPLPAPTLWLDGSHDALAEEMLAPVAGARVLALGPGANWRRKIWPADRFAEVTRRLRDAFDAVVILGDGRDAGIAAAVAQKSALPALDLSGQTSLHAAGAVLRSAQAFLGNDSGLGHIASAVGTPSLTLFGPGEPEVYRPWGAQADYMVAPGGDLAALGAEEVAARLLGHLEARRWCSIGSAPPAQVNRHFD